MQRRIKVYSFGYGRSGKPSMDVKIFDCRKLPNPHNDRVLRFFNGRDDEVKDFVLQSEDAHKIIAEALKSAVDGDDLAFGCYGGQHRSVALAVIVADRLRDAGHEVEIRHLDLR